MNKSASAKLKTANNVVLVNFGRRDIPKLDIFTVGHEFFNLSRFTALHIQDARDMAKIGQKDSARHWLRYIRNANVIQILSKAGLRQESLNELIANLRLLESECHLEDVPNFLTDLQGIRATMKRYSNTFDATVKRLRKTKLYYMTKIFPIRLNEKEFAMLDEILSSEHCESENRSEWIRLLIYREWNKRKKLGVPDSRQFATLFRVNRQTTIPLFKISQRLPETLGARHVSPHKAVTSVKISRTPTRAVSRGSVSTKRSRELAASKRQSKRAK